MGLGWGLKTCILPQSTTLRRSLVTHDDRAAS